VSSIGSFESQKSLRQIMDLPDRGLYHIPFRESVGGWQQLEDAYCRQLMKVAAEVCATAVLDCHAHPYFFTPDLCRSRTSSA
jgi:hypothetical protein